MASRKNLSIGAVMVLHAIARGCRYGFDLMEETGLASGTIYPALERLERSGLVDSEWEDALVARREKRPPRRYYTLNRHGAVALSVALERYKALAPLDLGTLLPES